jgi:site-specific recombinase XerD
MASDTNLVTLIQGFRLFCLAEGKQRTTIRWYMGELSIFLRYLRSHDLPVNASELTATHLRGFLVHLRENVKADENNPMKPARGRELSPKTIQGYARTPKAFFSWLAREGYIGDNPGRLLKIPKAPKVIINTLSDQQLKRLLSVIDRKSARDPS